MCKSLDAIFVELVCEWSWSNVYFRARIAKDGIGRRGVRDAVHAHRLLGLQGDVRRLQDHETVRSSR